MQSLYGRRRPRECVPRPAAGGRPLQPLRLDPHLRLVNEDSAVAGGEEDVGMAVAFQIGDGRLRAVEALFGRWQHVGDRRLAVFAALDPVRTREEVPDAVAAQIRDAYAAAARVEDGDHAVVGAEAIAVATKRAQTLGLLIEEDDLGPGIAVEVRQRGGR